MKAQSMQDVLLTAIRHDRAVVLAKGDGGHVTSEQVHAERDAAAHLIAILAHTVVEVVQQGRHDHVA